jgi:hypothetical protein
MNCTDKILQLELTRREYSDIRKRLVELNFYSEKVQNSSPLSFDDALVEYTELQKKGKIKCKKLEKDVLNLKKSCETCFNEWLSFHIKCCKRIIATTENKDQIIIAEECIKEWKKFKKNELLLENLNIHLLSDYDIVYDIFFAEASTDYISVDQSAEQN